MTFVRVSDNLIIPVSSIVSFTLDDMVSDCGKYYVTMIYRNNDPITTSVMAIQLLVFSSEKQMISTIEGIALTIGVWDLRPHLPKDQ